MMVVVPLDIGYGWTKGQTDKRLFRQPSIIGDSKPLHDENRRRGYLIYDDKYFVGTLAQKHSDIKYYSLKDNKADTWTTEVLMKTALAYLTDEDINLVTGLPIDYYFQQRKDFEELIDKVNGSNVKLEVIGEQPMEKELRITKKKIVPQPMGAVMDYLLAKDGQIAQREEAKKRLLVVDWGRYTLDLLILDGMEVHKASCSPPYLGIDTAYKLLRRQLREKVGYAPASYEVDTIVLSGVYEGLDVKPLIQATFKSVIEQIQLEVEGLNMNFHKCILAGGHANYLNDYLQVQNKHVGDQLSNMKGYEKMGRRLWREQ